MTVQFSHSASTIAGTTRTLIYGPVAANTVAIIFAGLFANIDTTSKGTHTFTLETYDGVSTYTTKLQDVPVMYGGSSECPKITLLPGESLYVTADAVSVIDASIEFVLRS